MRIVLLNPSPWKIPAQGEEPDQSGEGPPKGRDPAERLKGDAVGLPYGLLSLAAQAKRAGHDVTLLNLFLFAWKDITEIIRHFPADLYGVSCFTANRRGAVSLANLIRETYPQAYIVVGGPHASALPREMLEHCEAIDGVVIGEGEATFSELIECLERGEFAGGISGMAWRIGSRIEVGSPRKRIDDLDSLASPFDYFESDFIISSRGCPGNCTFCGSPSQWGRKVRFHSAAYTLDMIERLVTVHNKKVLHFKDDTFTLNHGRILQICEGIIKRGLKFLWSCDTRIDVLDEEVLFAMRRAGCQQISVGVESASPKILKSINKRINTDMVLKVTQLVKKFGLHIRYYMMVGNRGESMETLKNSINFIVAAEPNQFIFSFLNICPGTKEFEILESSGRANREMFFSEDTYNFTWIYGENSPQFNEIVTWIKTHPGDSNFWNYSIAELEAILELFPDLPSAHMDLGGAHYQLGNFFDAEKHIHDAINMGYPLAGLGYNYLACIAVSRGDLKGAIGHFEQAKKICTDSIVDGNLQSLRAWLETHGPHSDHQPNLIANHDLQRLHIAKQPMVPGPIVVEKSETISHTTSPAVFFPQ